MERHVFRHCKIITPFEVIRDGYIAVENGVIKEIGVEPLGSEPVSYTDCRGLVAVPGFIDTHIHGYGGIDTLRAEPHQLLEMSKNLTRHGVTSFIPTTVTAPHDELVEVCRRVVQAVEEWRPELGARILGLHLEGPYINPAKKGAQNEAFIRRPSIKEFDEYLEVSKGLVREITIAPEVEGALELIEHASSKGVTVSIGHTAANYEQGVEAIRRGARKATHIFNAMTGFHHREPGVVLALLQSEKVFVELIADFIHLHPAVVKMVIDLATPKRAVLITDAISATGLPDGEYELGGLRVVVEKGIPYIAGTRTLAGSTLTMDRAVKNVYSLGYGLIDVVRMASYTPAQSVDADRRDRVGALLPGFKADIVFLDNELNVVRTVVEGVVAYEKS